MASTQTKNCNQRSVNNKLLRSLITNIHLLISGVIVIASGFLIQINYHLGRLSPQDSIWGIDHNIWCMVHKWSAALFVLLITYHIYIHARWYRGVFKHRLLRKHRMVIFLTLLTLVVSITGIAPWLIDIFEGNQLIRHITIEIHDKIAILFSVLILWHCIYRCRWYINVIRKF